ncbi:MAG TPA: DUF4837 family protein [Aquaticitalea sp.]|nr:DUF4837 family protein [Aquaticitalea sp.]
MKRFPLIAIFSLLTLINCDERPNQKLIPQSSGNINTLLVVIDNLLWDDSVGEGIREAFAAPVQGLTNEEPIFSISQMPTSVFSGFATKNRIVLKIDKGSPAGVAFHKDALAIPQTMVVISGNTNQEIIDQIEANADTIIATFKKEEIKEKQRRIKLSLHDTKAIQEQLGINIDFPTVYRIATHSDNFFWIRKDIITGNMDFMIYQVPLDKIRNTDSTLVGDIIKMRDSIGKAHIQSSTEGAYMITEEAFAPYVFQTTIDNKPTIETKGIWDMKNAFMSGPFINYAIEDKANNRYLVLEGYVFAPSIEKRDYVFELEAILRSVKFK